MIFGVPDTFRDYVVHLEFDDGLEGHVDLSSYLGKGPIFAPSAELSYFKQFTLERNPRLAERSRYRARAALRNDGRCEPCGRPNALTRATIGRRCPTCSRRLRACSVILTVAAAHLRGDISPLAIGVGNLLPRHAVFLHLLSLEAIPPRSWECSSLFPLP
jgi:hypothetical protein